jgi:S-formylglutathione hydrolase FrmB
MWLTHGWVPLTAHVIAVAVLLLAVGWRSRRWLRLRLPVALLVGVAVTASVYWYTRDQGLVDEPAPPALWVWITLTGLAVGVLVLGWRGIRWWQRGVSVLAVPLCLLCAALTLNSWVAYLPTVQSAWDRLTGVALPGQIDQTAVAAMQRQGRRPPEGTVVSVMIPGDASGFEHREELVYLPPAWYSTTPPPRLPVVMMIGAEFGHPADWLWSGDAQRTIEHFSVKHDGNTPVLVFVDDSGSFSNDTECVNGPRGNVADHLTKDVVPFLVSHFRVRSDAAGWGIAGWSSGGTCALTLAVTHPELFSAFLDIDGQLSPNAGVQQQTIARLFGGDADAWAAFDPRTVITRHSRYTNMSAWFAVSGDAPRLYRPANSADALPTGGPASDIFSENRAAIAYELCLLASNHGIECAVVPEPGKHDWKSAASAFAVALPWLAGRLGTPGVPKIPMPGAPQRH